MVWNKKIQLEARRNRFKGGLLLGLSIFLSLSFLSYNPQDPSLNSFGLSLKVTNYCGFVGASLADLFYQLFGLASWLFIFGAFLLSYKFFMNKIRESLFQSLLIFTLFLLAFSSLSELHFSQFSFFDQQISLGGALGKIVISSLKPFFYVIGTAVLLWSAFLLVFLFYGQALFSSSLSPKKVLILFLIFVKKIPTLSLFAFSKSKKLYHIVFAFSQKSFIFLKAKFLFLKKFLLKQKEIYINRSAQTKALNQNSPSKPLDKASSLKAQNPSFVFKEKQPLTKKPFNKASLLEKTTLEKSDLEKTIPTKEKQILEKPSFEEAGSFTDKTAFAFAQLPSIDILSDSPTSPNKISRQDVEDLSKKLIDKLSQFSIQGEITAVKTGPAVVLFEFKPEDHIKVSRIREMESDLSLALSSESIRIIAPIPGRDVVGIEASRPYREMVYLKNLLKDPSFFKADLPLVLGRRADNVIGVKDLARIPHMLVAGTTGSGKSIFIISFIISLLFRHTPASLRLLIVDPKQVDLSHFKNIPHLLAPIITSSNKTAGALQWAINEMEKRYRSLALFGARDHKSFNQMIKNLSLKDKKLHEEKNQEASVQESYYFETLPLICIVIEEFGDLMADRNVRRAIENSVVRLAQKARASGIHLVLAMQSPRKDVVTGLIKTNIPGRISFKVASGTDSRVILDETGAEKLLSHGDMLFLEPGNPKPFRYHGPFVREKEVTEIVNYWKSQGEASYEESLVKRVEKSTPMNSNFNEESNMKSDPMYNEILEFIKSCDLVSASYLQRKFRIGYPRAARLIEVLNEEGHIGPSQGGKPREVLINK